MLPDHEFRCFVHQRKLVAISQYQCYVRFEALQDAAHVGRIRDAIVRFHDLIKDAKAAGKTLPSSYVMDVVVFPKDYSCSLIELNPFGSHMSSGAALYNWRKDEDLLYGRELGQRAGLPAIRVLRELIDVDAPSKA